MPLRGFVGICVLVFLAATPPVVAQCDGSITLRDDFGGINWISFGPVSTPVYLPRCTPLNAPCWDGAYPSGGGYIFGNGKVLAGVVDTNILGEASDATQCAGWKDGCMGGGMGRHAVC